MNSIPRIASRLVVNKWLAIFSSFQLSPPSPWHKHAEIFQKFAAPPSRLVPRPYPGQQRCLFDAVGPSRRNKSRVWVFHTHLVRLRPCLEPPSSSCRRCRHVVGGVRRSPFLCQGQNEEYCEVWLEKSPQGENYQYLKSVLISIYVSQI